MLTTLVCSLMLGVPGFNFSQERNVGTPIFWPTGERPKLIEVGDSFVVSASDGLYGVARMGLSDGGLSFAQRIGPAVSPVWLAKTSSGVLALFQAPGAPALYTQLLDLESFAGPQVEPALVSLAPATALMLVGEPGNVLMSYASGVETWFARLRDDGTVAGPPNPVAHLGRFFSIAAGHGASWGLFLSQVDGGNGAVLASVDDAGAPTVVATFAGEPMHLAAIPDGALVMTQVSETELQPFLWHQGKATALARLPACQQAAVVTRGEELWLICGSQPSHQLQLLLLGVDGAVQRRVSLELEPGEETPVLVGAVGGQQPQLLLTRTELRDRSTPWTSTWLLPLRFENSQGLLATPAFVRASTQQAPSFASAGPEGPQVLVWEEDRQSVDLSRLAAVATPVADEALILSAPRLVDFDRPQQDAAGKRVASDGRAFLSAGYGRLEVYPLEWGLDGGDMTRRSNVALGLSELVGPPLMCGLSSGYIAFWPSGSRWLARPLDTLGEPQAPVATVTTVGMVTDVYGNQAQCLAAVVTADAVSLVGVASPDVLSTIATVPKTDVVSARLRGFSRATLLVWEERLSPTLIKWAAVRVDPSTGAFLDNTPRETLLNVMPTATGRTLQDIGVLDETFYVFGSHDTAEDRRALVWAIANSQETPVDPIEVEALRGAHRIAVGQGTDGGMMVAYDRKHPEISPENQRLHVRLMFPELGVCPGASNESCVSPRGVRVFQLSGCGCGLGGAIPLSLCLLLLWPHKHSVPKSKKATPK